MVKSVHVLAVCTIAAALTAGATAAGAQTPVVFQGLPHTPVGSAALRIDPAQPALEVRNLGAAGEAGVAVGLKNASLWTSRFDFGVQPSLPLVQSWTAMSDGEAISTSVMRQSGNAFQVSAAFTGSTRPTYSAQVYNNGRLVGVAGGIPSGPYVEIPIAWCVFTLIWDCSGNGGFYNGLNGECEWRFTFGTDVPMLLPNGTRVRGNELRLVEEVHPAGHYPYLAFDGIVMRSNAYSFSILAESAR
jgi:hypothetical protein